MRRMMRARGTGVVVAAVVAGVLLAGCGSSDGDGGGGKAPAPSSSASSSVAALSVDEALDAYRQSTITGCTDADSCQAFMTEKLAALADLKAALRAEDPARFAEPIADIERAERLADEYGRDNLAAKGNMAAVSVPAQAAIRWLATNR